MSSTPARYDTPLCKTHHPVRRQDIQTHKAPITRNPPPIKLTKLTLNPSPC